MTIDTARLATFDRLWDGWPSPGTVKLTVHEEHADWARNMLTIRAEAVHGFTKVAATVPATAELLTDASALRSFVSVRLEDVLDRQINPWRYPDRVRGWAIDPLPTLTRLARWATTRRNRLTALRSRLEGAWDVARGHATIDTGDRYDW